MRTNLQIKQLSTYTVIISLENKKCNRDNDATIVLSFLFVKRFSVRHLVRVLWFL